jgi:hypothetical protein
MPSRIDTLTYAGFGFLGAGTTGELVKESSKEAVIKALECPSMPIKETSENIMDVNLFFGYLPGYEINLTGVIAIAGVVLMALSAHRGNKEKKRRIERETFPNSVVRDPSKK